MFGRPQACKQYELPMGLRHFVLWSGGRLGSVGDLAAERTCLDEWRCFVAPSSWLKAMNFLELGQPLGLRTALGMTASKAGSKRPLRYCRKCVSEQISKFGITC